MENYDEIIDNIKALAKEQGLDAVMEYCKAQFKEENGVLEVPAEVREVLISLEPKEEAVEEA